MRAALLLSCACLALLGCGRGSGAHAAQGGSDASTPIESGIDDAGSEAAPPCFTNPTTYLEIINACTDAEAVDKTDDLSVMNLPDGGLQPLP